MTNKGKDQAVGRWAKEKLDSLRAYLDYYTKRLKNQAWCNGRWYVDAFAGPGLSPVRLGKTSEPQQPTSLFDGMEGMEIEPDAVEYIKGSPRVALELQNPFGHYVFIENDADRVRELEALKLEFADTRDIQVLKGDANKRLVEFLSQPINWRSNKGVVFLDPFGMQVPWSTIERIGGTGGLETIVNFPWAMAINRLLLKSGEIPTSWQDRLDLTFGSGDWRSLVCEERSDLLGTHTAKREDATQNILKWFSGRLKDAFGYASEAQLVTNTRGNPLYYLIWAGPHPAGLVGANYILGRRKA
jgi:three-Cys-motif partner protein